MTTMSAEKIRQIALDVYEAINNQNIAKIGELFAPDIIRYARGEKGLDAAKRAVEAAFADNPTRRFVVRDIIVEGDKAALPRRSARQRRAAKQYEKVF